MVGATRRQADWSIANRLESLVMTQEAPDAVAQVYKQVGGEEPFYRLVDAFYSGVEQDELLRPLYPEDLSDAKRHLALFLIQRCGGPGTYTAERGHPRMRQRHMPFKIGLFERNAWMHHMDAALAATPEFAEPRAVLHEFFDGFSMFMINQPT
jgi:hemoglobin